MRFLDSWHLRRDSPYNIRREEARRVRNSEILPEIERAEIVGQAHRMRIIRMASDALALQNS